MDPEPKKNTPEKSPAQKGLSWQERVFDVVRKRGAIAVLILVVVISSIRFDNFLTANNLENVALQSAFEGLIVVGMTFVIIGKSINLSVGSQVALSGVVAAYASQVAWPLGVIAPVTVCGAIGLLQGLLIAKAKMAPFIVTLAGLLGIRGLALVISSQKGVPQNIAIENGSPLLWLGQGQIFGVAVPVFLMLLAFAIGGLVLVRTGYGQATFAVGDSEDSARLIGEPVDRVKIIAYTTNGLLAGLSGVLLATQLSSGQPTVGQGWELDVISEVVVGGTLLTGGTGTMSGSLAGVFLLNILQNLINQVGTLGSYGQQLVSGGFLIAVVVIQAYLTRKERL